MTVYDFNKKLNALLKGTIDLKSQKGKTFIKAYNALLKELSMTSFTEYTEGKGDAYIQQIILMFQEHPDLDNKAYADYIKFSFEEIIKSQKKSK